MGDYKGNEEALTKIYVREISLKGKVRLGFTYRYRTKDIAKNYGKAECVELLSHYLENGFRYLRIFTTECDFSFTLKKEGKWNLQKFPSSVTKQAPVHDKQKKRLIEASVEKAYLHDLGITDAEGNVYKNAQDKYKQINQYVSLLKPLIDELNAKTIGNIVDMGSGKGYLTFALYDFMKHEYGMEPNFVGVEYREDLVALCNDIARRSKFERLCFKQGSIIDHQGSMDLLIALHACDTATDDAIHKGIVGNASLIVVAPCCHKQIRKEMEKSRVDNDISFLTRHGIFLERQAEMLTDGLRAMVMEYFGYKTKIFQFISDAHTPKNVMLVGIKSKNRLDEAKKSQVLSQINTIKAYFGISSHCLEDLMFKK